MKRVLGILLVLTLIICGSGVYVNGLSKIGSRSDEVTAIQQALKERGYYNYTVDSDPQIAKALETASLLLSRMQNQTASSGAASGSSSTSAPASAPASGG